MKNDNADQLRQKLEAEQDATTRDAVFLASFIAVVSLTPLLVGTLLDNPFHKEQPVRRIASHSSTNAANTNLVYRTERQR